MILSQRTVQHERRLSGISLKKKKKKVCHHKSTMKGTVHNKTRMADQGDL